MSKSGQRHRDRGSIALRNLDRYVGIPVVILVGALRAITGRRAVPDAPRSIGLIKASGIGDVVVLSGVLRDVREALPEARLVLFTSANNDAFARLLDGPDEVIELPARNPFAAVWRVRRERLDVVIDCGMWPRLEALAASCSGAKCVIGMRTPRQYRHFGFDVPIEFGTDHEIQNDRNLVVPLGVISESNPVITRGEGNVRPLVGPYAVLHLWPGGSNSEERSWPTSRWRELAHILAATGLELVLSGGPSDVTANDELVSAWTAEGLKVRSICGYSPIETVVWLRHAAGVVSVNTGIMHLAAAVDAPVVALNGPTSVRRWGPIGPHVRCVVSPLVPAGYLNLGWERDERFKDAMSAITTDAVMKAWDDLREETASASA